MAAGPQVEPVGLLGFWLQFYELSNQVGHRCASSFSVNLIKGTMYFPCTMRIMGLDMVRVLEPLRRREFVSLFLFFLAMFYASVSVVAARNASRASAMPRGEVIGTAPKTPWR